MSTGFHDEALQFPDSIRNLRLLSLASGTGIAGAFVVDGAVFDHLFEPGKACLNIESPGKPDFPHGLAANNQVARGALEGITKLLLQIDEAPELEELGALARSELPMEELPGWLATSKYKDQREELIARARETFLVLGRALGDLVVTLNIHLDANAASVAGGPLQGLPEDSAEEIRARCALHGFELESGTASVRSLTRSSTVGSLESAVREALRRSSTLSMKVLEDALETVRSVIRLSTYPEIGCFFEEKYGSELYLPVSAVACAMNCVKDAFPDAHCIDVEFDGRVCASLVIPDDANETGQVSELLGRYLGALSVNQATTLGYLESNTADSESLKRTCRSIGIHESIIERLNSIPQNAGMEVISRTYYQTWRQVCAIVRSRDVGDDSTTPNTQTDSNEERPSVRVGVDIGGTEVKIAVAAWDGSQWALCSDPDGTSLFRSKTDHIIGKKPDDTYPPVKRMEAAGRILDAVIETVSRTTANGRVLHIGIVFPAAIAAQRAIGGTSGTVARFEGQTPIILKATPEQLLEFDLIGALQDTWSEITTDAMPRFLLTNDGPAFATGAILYDQKQIANTAMLANPQGALGAIGAMCVQKTD